MPANHNLTGADRENLKIYLSKMYSVGQLQLLYDAYSSDKPIPDRSESEKQMRLDVISELLGKQPNVKPHKSSPIKKRKKS